MNTQQAYIEGFVKRASEYGYSEAEAIEILKQAVAFPSNMVPNTPGSLAAPIATPVTGGGVPESLKTENQSNPMAGMMSGSNFYSSPQPAQSAAAAPAPIQPTQPAGPSNEFLTKVMGSYNPNSKVDQAQAERVRALYAQGKTTPNAIYADPSYKINREALGARKGSNASAYRGV